jgi:hypothetical protein
MAVEGSAMPLADSIAKSRIFIRAYPVTIAI